jgi:hypothetical protein
LAEICHTIHVDDNGVVHGYVDENVHGCDNGVVHGYVDENVHGCDNGEEMTLFKKVSNHQVKLFLETSYF